LDRQPNDRLGRPEQWRPSEHRRQILRTLGNSEPYSDPNTNIYSHSYAYGNCDCNSHFYSNSNTDCDSHSYGYTTSNRHTNTYSNSNTHCDCYSHPDALDRLPL
jgi:hypothetical protein